MKKFSAVFIVGFFSGAISGFLFHWQPEYFSKDHLPSRDSLVLQADLNEEPKGELGDEKWLLSDSDIRQIIHVALMPAIKEVISKELANGLKNTLALQSEEPSLTEEELHEIDRIKAQASQALNDATVAGVWSYKNEIEFQNTISKLPDEDQFEFSRQLSKMVNDGLIDMY